MRAKEMVEMALRVSMDGSTTSTTAVSNLKIAVR